MAALYRFISAATETLAGHLSEKVCKLVFNSNAVLRGAVWSRQILLIAENSAIFEWPERGNSVVGIEDE